MQKHNDAVIETSGHSSLEKYTSHFTWKGSKGLLKALLCERWIRGWTELQYLDPYSHGHNSVSFPFSRAAQPGSWEPSLSGICSSFQHFLSNRLLLNRGSWGPPLLGAGSLYRIWSPNDLNFLSPGLYDNLTSTYFLRASQNRTQFNPSTIKVISWYSSTGCTCYFHRWPSSRHSLFAFLNCLITTASELRE